MFFCEGKEGEPVIWTVCLKNPSGAVALFVIDWQIFGSKEDLCNKVWEKALTLVY